MGNLGEISISAVAGQALCLSESSGPVTLYSKAADKKVSPGSLVKLLTVVTAIRVLTSFRADMNAYQITIEGADLVIGSGGNLLNGDVLSFNDALKNMLLASSNITAVALARSVGSHIIADESSDTDPLTRFITEMNRVKDDLGMINSNFKNPSGLGAVGQYSTASDISLLMIEAERLHQITDIWGMTSADLKIIGPNERTESIKHTIPTVSDVNILGGKSGTLAPSIYSASLVVQGLQGKRIITTVLSSKSSDQRYADLQAMIDTVYGC